MRKILVLLVALVTAVLALAGSVSADHAPGHGGVSTQCTPASGSGPCGE